MSSTTNRTGRTAAATLTAAALVATLAGCQPGGPAGDEAAAEAPWSPSTTAQNAAAAITADMLRADIAHLSSDDLAGEAPRAGATA